MSKNLSRYGQEEALRMLAKQTEEFVFEPGLMVQIEVNKETMAKVTKLLDDAREAGKKPQDVELPVLGPEEQDIVMYARFVQVRSSQFLRQSAKAGVQGQEIARMSLKEMLNRAQLQFDGGLPDAKA
jgi:hypothetical protein